MSAETEHESNRRVVEEVLRNDLPPGRLVKTEEVVRLCSMRGVPKSPAYSAVLAIARRCPAASQDKAHAFVRFHRTCYPWVWRALGAAEPLMVDPQEASRLFRAGQSPELTLTEADFGEIERRVAALLGLKGEFQLATLGAVTAEPEECLLCRQPSTECIDGICPNCFQ